MGVGTDDGIATNGIATEADVILTDVVANEGIANEGMVTDGGADVGGADKGISGGLAVEHLGIVLVRAQYGVSGCVQHRTMFLLSVVVYGLQII
nr:hypothetical protein [Tanacetum cinerariifolium]